MQLTDSKAEQGVKQEEPKSKLSPELIAKYYEIFKKFDKQDDDQVLVKDLSGIMKILGVTITESEVMDMLGDKVMKSEVALGSSKIEFPDFLSILVKKESEIAMKEELMYSFKVFDPESNGFVTTSEFRYYLRTYGIAMAAEEVEDMIKDSEPEEGYVKYEKFVNKMLGIVA